MRHRNGFSDAAVRNGKWKAVKAYIQPWVLYDVEKNIEESNDVSGVNPQILKKMVTDVQKWSEIHIQPKWWHDEKTGEEWKADGMLHFDNTFKIKQI